MTAPLTWLRGKLERLARRPDRDGDWLWRNNSVVSQFLSSCFADPDLPLGLSIDDLIVVDEESLFVRGWLFDVENTVQKVELVSPAGARIELLDRLYRFARPDVTNMYRPRFGERADGEHGFLGLVEIGESIRDQRGFFFELSLLTGERLPAGTSTFVTDPFLGRHRLMRSLPDWRFLDLGLLEDRVVPALEKIRAGEAATVTRSFEHGAPPASPAVSIIVPLGRRLDLLEHQLAHFAGDPDLEGSELIFVLDAPGLEHELEQTALHLSRLYQLPLRGLVLSRDTGYAAAANLGAVHARGSLLVVMHSDVFADRPGWLGAMAERYGSRAELGVLGVKLLCQDQSLHHAGLHLEHGQQADGLWSVRQLWRGLPRHHPAADLGRQVAAVSGGCLMIERQVFERAGGFRDAYMTDGFEDIDLCLRCLEEGHLNWYFPDAELFHLEGLPRPVDEPEPVDETHNPWAELYDRWLQSRLWGERIEQLMSPYPDPTENA